ncbi:MAG: hypothetical protein RL582_1000 [Bacteroidota bacterium]
MVLTMFLFVGVYAQRTNIKFFISDQSKQPFFGVTATIFQLPDTIEIENKVLTSSDSIRFETGKKYLLRFTAAGKKTLYLTPDFSLDNKVLRVVMVSDDAAMQTVVIRSKKPLIKEEDDKTIVDATSIASSSTNAFEVLEKTPGAIIDQDGNVYLNSTTPASIQINGREMKMSSADLSALLKSLPANSIQKIEVLRNPSAKYDASSSGGILNIVLKKGVKLGNNGSVNVAYFQGVYATGTAGVTFNHQGDKWNYYTNYQFTKKNSFEQLNSIRGFTTDSLLINQQSYTTYPSLSHYFNGGTDRTFSNGITIGFDTRLTSNNNSSNANNNLTFGKIGTEGFVGNNLLRIGNKNQSYYWSNTANLKYKFDTSGSEWNNVVEYTMNHFRNRQDYVNEFPFPVGVTLKGDGSNKTDKNHLSVNSDLTLKIKGGITLETGFKLYFGRSENESLYYKDTGTRFVDAFQTNTYAFNDNLHAAYLQASKTILGFIIKPGLRFEHTDIRGVQRVPSDTSFSIRRNDVFPYLFIKHKLFKMFGQMLVASGTLRRTIRRPYYEALNPFPKFIDQFLYEQGNPSLRPQFTNNYELSVTFNDIPVASIGVNQTKDIFSNVIYQDDQTKIAYRTFDNLGKNKEIYARLIAGIPPGGKYFFYIGGLYNFNAYRGFFQGQPFNYDRGSFTFFTFHEFKYSNTLTLSMQGFLRSKGLQQFYELETFGGMFLSANKSILKRKANLILSVSDVLRTNRVTFNFNRNQQLIEGNRINDTRRVGLTFRYNFGIKPKEEKKSGFEGAAENANP